MASRDRSRPFARSWNRAARGSSTFTPSFPMEHFWTPAITFTPTAPPSWASSWRRSSCGARAPTHPRSATLSQTSRYVLFNSPEFAIFFAVVLAAMAASPDRHRMRVLLAASLVFYLLWVPRYLALLLGTVAANHVIVRRMVRSAHPGRYLAASIVLTLSLLGAFKYAGFAVDLANPLLRRVLGRNSPAPELVLPLGISFYTFELISLSVDIYRRRLPCPTFGRYVLFVTF